MGEAVYVVTEGSYSDYHIVCVWSTREKAQAYVDAAGPESYEIEEYSLDPLDYVVAMDAVKNGLSRYEVSMWRDGSLGAVARLYSRGPIAAEPLVVRGSKWQCGRDGDDGYYYGQLCLTGDVWARDEQHALKIATEHRAMLIATDQWPED